jgi:hypothetical protein
VAQKLKKQDQRLSGERSTSYNWRHDAVQPICGTTLQAIVAAFFAFAIQARRAAAGTFAL